MFAKISYNQIFNVYEVIPLSKCINTSCSCERWFGAVLLTARFAYVSFLHPGLNPKTFLVGSPPVNTDVRLVTVLFAVQYYHVYKWNYCRVQVNPVVYELKQLLARQPALVGKKAINQRNESSQDDLVSTRNGTH